MPRTEKATLGAMKPLDRFDWSFPRTIERLATRSIFASDCSVATLRRVLEALRSC